MANLDQTTQQELIATLTPFMIDHNERQALLHEALGNAPILQRIDFSGAADTFTVNMVSNLLYHDQASAIIALLLVVRRKIGSTKGREINRLRRKVARQCGLPVNLWGAAKEAFNLLLQLGNGAILFPLVILVLVLWFVWGSNVDWTRILSQIRVARPTPTSVLASPDIPLSVTVTPPAAEFAALKENFLVAVRTAEIPTAYPQQAERLVDALVAHLAEFQRPDLGVTTVAMQQALSQPDAGNRVNALVQRVWGEWLNLTGNSDANAMTITPDVYQYNLSPFRILVIRLIQGQQGVLVDSEQHALQNFFSRREDPSVWRNDVDGVISAINRESFQWPS